MLRRPALAPLVFGLVLAGMAVGQALSFGAFRDALESYDLLGDTGAVGVAVIAVESFAGAGLLLSASLPRVLGQAAGAAGLVVALFWAVLAVQAFARGLDVPNCGCFGAYLAQSLRWWVLLEDAYLLALAYLAARSVGTKLSPGLAADPRRTGRSEAR